MTHMVEVSAQKSQWKQKSKKDGKIKKGKKTRMVDVRAQKSPWKKGSQKGKKKLRTWLI